MLLKPRDAAPQATNMRNCRVFLSSTFADFRWERDTVNRLIVPDVNAKLASRGMFIDLVDLSRGVTMESGLEHDTSEICLEEVRLCCRGNAKPALVLLHGSRAGWRPLPRVIPADEFRQLRAVATAAVELLDEWYELDENFLFPSHQLRRRTGKLEQPEVWRVIEDEIRRGVLAARGKLSPFLVRAFEIPMTRREVEAAFEWERSGDLGLVAAFRRELIASPALHDSVFYSSDQEAAESREEWSSFASRLGDDARAEPCTVEIQGQLDTRYQKAFIDWFTSMLLNAAARASAVVAERSFVSEAPSPRVSRDIERELRGWLCHGAAGVRLLFGTSGSGKTSIVRALAELGISCVFLGSADEEWGPDSLCTTIRRATGVSSSGEPTDSVASPGDPRSWLQGFSGVLCVDGLERGNFSDPSVALAWLPEPGTTNAHILVTTADPRIRDAFVSFFGHEHTLTLDEVSDEDSRSQIAGLLSSAGRRLQPSQLDALVVSTTGGSGRALVNALAAATCRRTHSKTVDLALPSSAAGWLSFWKSHLVSERRHSEDALDATLSLICAARLLVPERLVVDFVSQDPRVLAWLERAFLHYESAEGFPRTVHSRLLAELDGVVELRSFGHELCLAFANDGIERKIFELLSKNRVSAARRFLFERARERLTLNAADHWAASQILYQLVLLGSESVPALRSVVGNPDLVISKLSADNLGVTLLDLRLLEESSCFDDPVLEAFVEFMKQEWASLSSMGGTGMQRDWFMQLVADLDPTRNPFAEVMAGEVARSSARRLSTRLRVPDLRGVTVLAVSSAIAEQACMVGDELAIADSRGALQVVEARTGIRVRSLKGHPGSVRDLFVDTNGRLYSCGYDGEVAITSVKAGRDLRRLSADGVALDFVRPAPGDHVVAASSSAQRFFRWDESGNLTGSIGIERPLEGRELVIDDGDDVRAMNLPLRPRMYFPPFWWRRANAWPSGNIRILDSDRIATGGPMGGAIWSFDRGGVVAIFRGKQSSPRHLIPTTDGKWMVVTDAGGIVLFDPASGDSRRLQVSGTAESKGDSLRGGTAVLPSNRLWVWSLVAPGLIQARILDVVTASVQREAQLRAHNVEAMQYFRSAASSVNRGVLELDEHRIFAWSAYGCELVDFQTEEVRQLVRWDSVFCEVHDLGDGKALAIRLGMPTVIDMHTGATIASFEFWSSELRSAVALGQGRFLVTGTLGLALWDLPRSLRARTSSVGAQEGSDTPSRVRAALALPENQVLVSCHRSTVEPEASQLWQIAPQGATFLGSLPTHAANGGSEGVERSEGLALTWGSDGRLRIGLDSPAFEIFLPGARVITGCVAIPGREGELGILCTASDAAWLVQPVLNLAVRLEAAGDGSDGAMGEVQRVGDEIYIWTKHELWRFVDSISTKPSFARVLNPREYVTCEERREFHTNPRSVHRASSGSVCVAWASVVEQSNPDVEDRFHFLLGIAFSGSEVVGAAAFARASISAVLDRACLIERDGWDTHILVRFDPSSDSFLLKPAAAGVHLPAPQTAGRTSFSPIRGVTLTTEVREMTLEFSPGEIVRRTPAETRRWLSPGGYQVLDLDRDKGRLLVSNSRGFQVLDVDSPQSDIATPLLTEEERGIWNELRRASVVRVIGSPLLGGMMAESLANRLCNEQPDMPKRVFLFAMALWQEAEAHIDIGEPEQARTRLSFLQRLKAANETALNSQFSGLGILSWRLELAAARTEAALRLVIEKNWVESLAPVGRRLDIVRAVATFVRRGGMNLAVAVAFHRALTVLKVDDLDPAVGVELAHFAAALKLVESSDADLLADVDWAKQFTSVPPANAVAERPTLLQRAEQGDPQACFELGQSFGLGHGVKTNPQFALHWYLRAIELGHDQAAMNAAGMYVRGEGVAKDLARARDLFGVAAERGVVFAMTNFADMLASGRGGARDHEAAKRWATLALSKGDGIAARVLAQVYLDVGDLERARDVLVPVASAGDTRAGRLLAQVLALLRKRSLPS